MAVAGRAFKDDDVFTQRAVRADGPLSVKIAAGDPSRAISLTGTDGAPRVRVTTPGGKTVDSPDGPGFEISEPIRILRSEQNKQTVVGFQDPPAGTYTIETLPGSPAITNVAGAEDPPAAKISASVTPDGASASAVSGPARRTITYDIVKRPDQRVTFVEAGPDGSRPIG